jgi:hypothetical protein
MAFTYVPAATRPNYGTFEAHKNAWGRSRTRRYLGANCADNKGCARDLSCMISTKSTESRRHRDRDYHYDDRPDGSLVCLSHVFLPRLETLQAALYAAQCSLGTPCCSTRHSCTHCTRCGRRWGSKSTWRSPAPDAPALEPEEAALVVAPLSAEQAESMTGCGEIDMAEASAKS